MSSTIITMKDGKIEIPAEVRERYGMESNARFSIVPRPDGIVLRPADWPEPELYTPERIAEFLLNNAVDEDDYAWAVAEVREMGIDPQSVPHEPLNSEPNHRRP